MLEKIIKWILSWFGWGREVDAGIEGAEGQKDKEDAAVVAGIEKREGGIDAKVKQDESRVDATSDSSLDGKLDDVLDQSARANRNRNGTDAQG